MRTGRRGAVAMATGGPAALAAALGGLGAPRVLPCGSPRVTAGADPPSVKMSPKGGGSPAFPSGGCVLCGAQGEKGFGGGKSTP